MRNWADIQADLQSRAGTAEAPVERHDDGESLAPLPTPVPDPSPEIEEALATTDVAGWDETWRHMGRSYDTADGSMTSVRLYPIGALAKALGREPTTLRKWERNGWLPRPKRLGPHMGRGARRLYTAEEIEGLIAAADVCGLLVDVRTSRVFPADTQFPRLARLVLGG